MKNKWNKTQLLEYTQKKSKYFVLESSIFRVIASTSMENLNLENKTQLSSTNF